MSKAVRTIVGVGLIVLAIVQPEFAPFIAAHAFAIGAIGASLAIGAILEKKPLSLHRLQQQNVLVRSSIAPQELVLGRDKKSGVLAYYGTSGSENEYLWFVITVCEHLIDGYETLWLYDVPIDIATQIDTNDMVTHTDFIDADGKQLVKAVFYLGEDDQVVDPDLEAAFAEWDYSHKGEGVAYFWVRLELDKSEGGNDPESAVPNVWDKGYPDTIAVTVRGAPVYDPRLDSANGGSGSHRADDDTTWEWSENSALNRTHYLRSSRFGPGFLSSEVIWATVADHADTADEAVDIPDSLTQPRYTLNGVVIVDRSPKEILEDLQTADHGMTLIGPDGVQVMVGRFETSAHTIDETWLAGGFTAETALATDDLYNAVRGQYMSADEGYSVIEFQPRTASAYETEDGIGTAWKDIVLPYTREEYRAQHLAIIELKKSRQQIICQGDFNFRAELVEAYEIVTVNIQNFSSDTFRVMGKTTSTNGITTLQLREEVASDWTYTVPDLAEPPVVPSVVRNPDGVTACTALAGITRAGGIQWVWAHPNLSGISHVELYTAASNDRSLASFPPTYKGKNLEFFDYQDEDVDRWGWVVARGNNGPLSQWFPVGSTSGIQGTAGALTAGANAIFGILTNETVAVPAEEDGGNYDLTYAGGTFQVWDGTANVTGLGPVYSVLDTFETGDPVPADTSGVSWVTFNGLRMSIDAETGVYTLSADSDWVAPAGNIGNAYTLRAVYGGVTIDKTYTIIKALGGVNAKLLTISATAQTFAYDTDGALKSADEIVFTADQQNSSETIYWTTQKWNGVDDWEDTTNRISAPAQGATAVLTEANFDAEGEEALRIVASFSDPPTVQYYIDTITVTKVQDGAAGADAVLYYIKPTAGTAIQNGSGELTVEAHQLIGGTDNQLSSGTIKLYVGSTEVTVANGYASGSDGYTGVFDSGDISGAVVVELKDGPAGTVLDTITLVDVADGGNGVYGYIEAENGGSAAPLSWTRAVDQSTWSPTTTSVDLNATFVQAGVAVARYAWRITRAADGTLTGGSTTHKDGNLNATRVTVTELNEGGRAMGVKFDYSYDGDDGSVTETVVTSLSGADGAIGATGPAGVNSQITAPVITAKCDSDGNFLTRNASSGLIEDEDSSTKFGYHKVYSGDADVTTSATHSVTGPGTAGSDSTYSWRTYNGIRCYVWKDDATYAGYYFFYAASDDAMTDDEVTFTLRATYGGQTFDKTVTISKIKAGASGAGGEVAALQNTQVVSVGSGTRTAGYQVDSDGSVYKYNNALGFNAFQDWLKSGSNSDYEVYWEKLSGSASLASGSSSADTWLACSTDRFWKIQNTSGGASYVGLITIRKASDETILASGQVTLYAEGGTA